MTFWKYVKELEQRYKKGVATVPKFEITRLICPYTISIVSQFRMQAESSEGFPMSTEYVVDGLLDWNVQTVYLSEDLDEAEQFSVLMHEIAHYHLHEYAWKGIEHYYEREAEATLVEYIIARYFGVVIERDVERLKKWSNKNVSYRPKQIKKVIDQLLEELWLISGGWDEQYV